MKKLRTLRDWITVKESTPTTRSKRQAALGLGPVSTAAASLYGHSTPPPGITNLLKKNSTKQVVKNDIWTIPEEERSPDYTFDKWIQSVLDKAKELADAKNSAEEEDEKLDKEIASRLKEKDKAEAEPEPKGTEHETPQEDDEEEIGKESRWTGHRREQEDREKAGIGPTAGRRQS